MAFKQTEWKYSSEKISDKKYGKPKEGLRNLQVEDALFDPDGKYGATYNITFLDLDDVDENGDMLRFRLFYTVDPKEDPEDSDEQRAKNQKKARSSKSTLCMLGQALFADDARGIPYADDIIGGVVTGDVTYGSGEWPRIYKFQAAPKDAVINNSTIDQAYEGWVPGGDE